MEAHLAGASVTLTPQLFYDYLLRTQSIARLNQQRGITDQMWIRGATKHQAAQ